jgi:exopolyphosphatase / guanosine-5'-triphosphate,3'-diphosphate pyrophosphatase
MKNGNYAVLDLGTNTFNLLIVNITNNIKTELAHERISVKIGKGGIQHNHITTDACHRAVDAVKHFRGIIDSFGVKNISAVATSAFRNAHNGKELAARIKLEADVDIQIIDGENEAELIYYGVKSAMDIGDQVSLIMDIGGGSVEFILCDSLHVFWKKSYEIGAQRLVDMFHNEDPIDWSSVEALDKYLDKTLIELHRQVQKYRPTVLIGSSGTFDTLCDIYIHDFNIDYELESGTEFEFPIAYFEVIYRKIVQKNLAERRNISGMSEMRVDMIVVAVCLIEYILKKYSIERLRTSLCSLKEGLLFLMNGPSTSNIQFEIA